MADLPFTRLQHIGIPVRALEVSMAFYRKLGFEEKMRSTFEIPEGTGTCVMMQKSDITLELYELPESMIESDIKHRKNGPIDHIAFDVEDIGKVFALAEQEGFQLVQKEPVYLPFWKKGCKFFHLTGPDGERIEFNEIL